MERQAIYENIAYTLSIIACLIVITAIALLILEYFFDLLIGWSAGIVFFIALGAASVFSIVALPFSVANIRMGYKGTIKTNLPLYIAPFGIVFLAVMIPLL